MVLTAEPRPATVYVPGIDGARQDPTGSDCGARHDEELSTNTAYVPHPGSRTSLHGAAVEGRVWEGWSSSVSTPPTR